MDVGTASVGIALGAVVVALALAWAGSTRDRARDRSRARVDDLADFLEHPPGTREEPPRAAGWVGLAPEPPAPLSGATARRWWVAAGAAVTALALAGAVVVATGGDGGRSTLPVATRPAGQEPDAGTLEADLAFAGLVLEQRAVGITAAYPEAQLTTGGDGTRLTIRLPTYNCLAAVAPPDPEAAGCVAAAVEQGTVQTPDLRLERSGGRLLLSGELATWTDPTGSPPEPTGRVYPLQLTLSPGDQVAAGGWRDVLGRLELGTESAPADEGSRVRAAG
ncbi:hypothetical protein ACI79P_08700 [Blastococcus sp. SYSU DS0510]